LFQIAEVGVRIVVEMFVQMVMVAVIDVLEAPVMTQSLQCDENFYEW
jgi:hypothetical protein